MKPQVWALPALFALALAATGATHLAIYQESDFFQEWLITILWVDFALIGLLFAGVIWNIVLMIASWRRGKSGARLSLRIALLLWGASLLPALLLYSVSVGAVFRGIESWFDIPLGESFERGILFGQDVVGKEFDRLEYIGRDITRGLPARSNEADLYIQNAQFLYGLNAIALYDRYGKAIASRGATVDESIPSALVRHIQSEGIYLNLAGAGADRITELMLPAPGGRAVLFVSRPLPEEIAFGLLEVERGLEEYEKLRLLRTGLRWSFILTMSLSLALILFAAGWFSLYLGARLVRPLVNLTAAAEAVGRGNFEYRLDTRRSLSEIAHLNTAFNAMVLDLKKLHYEEAERQETMQKINAYLESLLSTLTTGVLTFSADGRLQRYNAAADNFFDAKLESALGAKHLPASVLSPVIEEAMAALQSDEADIIERRAALDAGGALLVRARRLAKDTGSGVLVMIDDITRQIRAEREATWEEASRRFVHEIKNPLTPIQLAAERLQHKLHGSLSPANEQVLERLVEMIVSQVGAMRQMVDSFRDYADAKSQPVMREIQLNDLIARVLYFYQSGNVKIHCGYEDNLPLIMGNAVTLRQLLHNVLGNAIAVLDGRDDGEIYISTQARGSHVRLTIEDNGGGVPEAMIERICEPYVTDRPGGTGLGLAVVRRTVEEHGGELHIKNGARGLVVSAQFALKH